MKCRVFKIVSALFVCSILDIGISGATVTTGSLRGVAQDSTGAPLPGVHVELSGPLLGEKRTTRSDEHGIYRFALLPPDSRYVLAFEVPGFERLAKDDVNVSLGQTTRIDINLRPALEGEMTISATTSLVDLTNAAATTSLSRDQYELLPTSRDFQQLTVLAPGVMFDTRSETSPTIGGATHLENDYIIEGLSTRDPLTGSSATNLTMNFVDEVQIITATASAQYGRATGGIINVLTRGGSNDLTADVRLYFADAEWASSAIKSSFRGTTREEQGSDKGDLNLSLGGPISRDRAWFFGAFGPRRETYPIRLVDQALGIDRTEEITITEDIYAAKLTVATGSSQRFTLSGFGNPTEDGGWRGAVRADPPAALFTNVSGSDNLTARYDGTFGTRTWVEAGVGRHAQEVGYHAETELGAQAPSQYDGLLNYRRGGVAHEGIDESDRRALNTSLWRSYERHDLRIGGEYERSRHDSSYVETSYGFWGNNEISETIGVRPLMEEYIFDFSGFGENELTSFYVEDQYRGLNDLVLTLGVRWEQQVISSGQGVTILEGIDPDGEMIGRPADSFTFGDNWAPRVGIVWDPTGRGRSRVYAAGGRYFEVMPVATSLWYLNGFGFTWNQYYSEIPRSSENWYNPAGSPLDDDWILFGESGRQIPPRPHGIDPTIKMQYQDEYSIGADVQIGDNTTVGARLVDRRVQRVIDDRAAYHESDPTAFHDEYFLINVGEGQYGSAFERPQRKYQAIELTYHRRLTGRWQVISSFVSARARGDYDGFYEYSTGARSANTSYAYDLARYQENAFGRLRGDRPYQFKIHSSYELPWGLTVSEGFLYSSGIPVSAISAPRFSGGKRILYFTPRGSEGRTPDHWTLDLHADWRPAFLKRTEVGVSVVADIFNATNNHEVLEVDENYIIPGMPGIGGWTRADNLDAFGFPKFDPNLPVSPYYGTPTLYQSPRTIQLGVKISYR